MITRMISAPIRLRFPGPIACRTRRGVRTDRSRPRAGGAGLPGPGEGSEVRTVADESVVSWSVILWSGIESPCGRGGPGESELGLRRQVVGVGSEGGWSEAVGVGSG